MPNWGEVLEEINGTQQLHPLDAVRRKYLNIMHKYTERNIIAYYSGFLQHPGENVSIDDNDKNAFMQAVHELDKTKGLDLILHTPGGNIAATESIVNYIKAIFGNDVRAFIPQIAMSAGTMIALSCKEIVMGKQSNVGPIDPQFGGMSCAGVIEEFEKAIESIKQEPATIPIWQAFIASNYNPTFLGDCQKAITWSNQIVEQWLKENMFKNDKHAEEKVRNIVDKLSSHEETFNHARHIHIQECLDMGIKVTNLEDLNKNEEIDGCKDLQDCVLTIHHTYMHTFSKSPAVKIVENHLGKAMIINSVKQ